MNLLACGLELHSLAFLSVGLLGTVEYKFLSAGDNTFVLIDALK